MRLIEGNSHPGNEFTGDNLPEPVYCPVCGRSLEYWGWTTVDETTIYGSLVCYGGVFRTVVWLWQHLLSPTTPFGAHYQYRLPVREVPKNVGRYDRFTGRPIH